MRCGAIIIALLLAVGLGIYLLRRPNPMPSQTADSNPPEMLASNVSVTAIEAPGAPSRRQQLLGEVLLRDYGRTNLPPENDLNLMYRLMDNSLLLLKSAGNQPLSANEDWAALLCGHNAAHERFLPDKHIAVDTQGRLVDRWGVPLFFHALGGGRYELRSAGPDKKMWTADDIHRNSDGSFRHGADLDSSSLLEASQRHPSK